MGPAASVAGATTDLTIDTLHWVTGECLPSSGSIVLLWMPPVTVTFLPVTPTTGEVDVAVGSWPSSTTTLLAPCH